MKIFFLDFSFTAALQSKSLISDSGVIFSPPSILRETLSDSDLLLDGGGLLEPSNTQNIPEKPVEPEQVHDARRFTMIKISLQLTLTVFADPRSQVGKMGLR